MFPFLVDFRSHFDLLGGLEPLTDPVTPAEVERIWEGFVDP